MSRRKGIQLCYPLEESRLAKWTPPFICQPKLDGDRSRAVPYGDSNILLSSEENPFYYMNHIHEELITLPRWEYDGELYAHHLPHNEIHSRVSRELNPHPLRREIEYHIFDIINSGIQAQRTVELRDLEILHTLEYVKFVPSYLAYTFNQVWAYYEEFIIEGYEGIIVRDSASFYKRSRSSHIMKFKPKQKDVYLVTGSEEEVSIHGVPKGRLGKLNLTDPEGNVFNVGAGLNDADRTTLWECRSDLPGQWCTITYQHLTSKRKVPRHSVYVELSKVKPVDYDD